MIEAGDKAVWFAEPDGDDDWFKRKGETTFAWVSRATSDKGKECRRFLNENIAKLPQSWQTKLHSDLRTRDWDSVFFELVVGRTLQILGASIEVEVPVASTNKRPDFVATFPDGVVTVEATATPTMKTLMKLSSHSYLRIGRLRFGDCRSWDQTIRSKDLSGR